MIIHKLTMKNFKQYRDQEVDFREGLTGIIGKNGSGKSSLFEAMVLALFGEIPFVKDYLRSSSADEKDPVAVELVFEIDGKGYRVVREYRGKNLTAKGNLYRGEDELLATGTREVNEEIEKIVGMGKDAFTRSIFSGQKELGAISDATGGSRRELVRKMVGMDRIDRIQQLVRTDRNALKNEVAGQESMLLSDDEIVEKNRELEELKVSGEALKKEIEETEKGLALAEKAYTEAKERFKEQQVLFRKYSDIKAQADALSVKIESIDESIASGTERLDELNKEKDEAGRLEPKEKEFISVKKEKERLDDLKVKHTRVEGLQKQAGSIQKEIEYLVKESAKAQGDGDRLAGVDDELKKAREGLKAIENEIEKANSGINRLNSAIGSVKGLVRERSESIEKITKAGKGSSCPTCLRPLKDAYETTLEKLNADVARYQGEELAALEAELKKQNETLAALKQKEKDQDSAIEALNEMASGKKQIEKDVKRIAGETAKKKEELAKLEAEIKKAGTIDYDGKKHGEVRAALDELQQIHDRYTALNEKIKGIPKLTKELENQKENRNKLIEEKKQKDAELAAVPYTDEKYTGAENAQADEEKKRDEARDKLTEKKDEYRDITHQEKTTKKELDDDRARRKTVKKNREEYQALDKLDAYLDEFKNAVLDQIRPWVSRYASGLFEQLTGGLYEAITVDDDFGFMISDQGQEFPIDRFSGGEKDLANLCLRLAISRVISDLEGGGAMGFLGFDEIFGSQDDDRRFEILQAFHKLQEIYRQIFIITHLGDVKEEFPQILEVSRIGGRSEVGWL